MLRAFSQPVNAVQGFFGVDCSLEPVRLEYGQTQMRKEKVFEYDTFQLPPGKLLDVVSPCQQSC